MPELSLVHTRPDEVIETALGYRFDRLPDSVARLSISPAAKILYADRYNYFLAVTLPAFESSKRVIFTSLGELSQRTTIFRNKLYGVLDELVQAKLLRIEDNPDSFMRCRTFIPLYYTDGSDMETAVKSAKAGNILSRAVARHQKFLPIPIMLEFGVKGATRFVDALVAGAYRWAVQDEQEIGDTVSVKGIARRLNMNRRTVRDSLARLKAVRALELDQTVRASA